MTILHSELTKYQMGLIAQKLILYLIFVFTFITNEISSYEGEYQHLSIHQLWFEILVRLIDRFTVDLFIIQAFIFIIPRLISSTNVIFTGSDELDLLLMPCYYLKILNYYHPHQSHCQNLHQSRPYRYRYLLILNHRLNQSQVTLSLLQDSHQFYLHYNDHLPSPISNHAC